MAEHCSLPRFSWPSQKVISLMFFVLSFLVLRYEYMTECFPELMSVVLAPSHSAAPKVSTFVRTWKRPISTLFQTQGMRHQGSRIYMRGYFEQEDTNIQD